MVRKTILSLLLLLCLTASTLGAEFTLKPFLFEEDFEEKDPVKFWTSNGTFTVNFKGLTEEKAFTGKKAFKLDVTFQTGTYFYWSIPVRIPAEGKLSMSGHVYLGKQSTGRMGLGRNVVFPPTRQSGCAHFAYASQTGIWEEIQGDLVHSDDLSADRLIPNLVWEATGPDVGVYVDRVGVFLYGKPGQRVIVYLDDIKIWGEVPDAKDYDAAVSKRWQAAEARAAMFVDTWNSELSAAEKALTALGKLSAPAEKMRAALVQKIAATRDRISVLNKNHARKHSNAQDIAAFMENMNTSVANIFALSKRSEEDDKLLLYVVEPVSPIMHLPSDTFPLGELFGTVDIVTTPGEYEPGSFLVQASSDISGLTVSVSDLEGETSTLPSSSIDVKSVKCWYQAGTAWVDIRQDRSHRVLVPELLLNDDTLVRVNTAKQRNFLKLVRNDIVKYIDISDVNDKSGEIIRVETFPIKDSPHLRPLDIATGQNKQFWLTVKTPESIAAGVYNGNIHLMAQGKRIGSIPLQITVLPFKLDAPYYKSSIYYRAKLDPKWAMGSISSEYKSIKQFKAELANMVAHGVTNPTVYQPFDTTLLSNVLNLRREAGMTGSLYYLGQGVGGLSTDAKTLATIKKNVREVLNLAKAHGIDEVYFYGRDEATGKLLAAQRPAWQAAREAGGKLFVAGYRGKDGNFATMGDIQDMLVCSGIPSSKEAAMWHSKGQKILCYNNPQVGVENPAVYRRNFGLLLWKNNYDGAMDYAYQHGFDSIWNDFDNTTYRDLNFTYPTINGVIDTIAWEGYREGVDDVRYLTTLLNAIDTAETMGTPELKAAVADAHRALNTLDLERGDMTANRKTLIEHILKLHAR